ncbi:MAG: BMC domain-containing protein [Mobilitalea sp.]
MKALGMIEVYGYVVAIEALDSALKAANVSLVDTTLVRGGLVTVLITGEVGAVKAAMDASKTAAERIGKVISVHVIPRPSQEIEKIIPLRPSGIVSTPAISKAQNQQENSNPAAEKIGLTENNQQQEVKEKVSVVNSGNAKTTKPVNKTKVNKTGTTHLSESDRKQIRPDMLQGMTVERLRSLARDLGITNMTRKQIRFASKHELIESISKFIEQER